MKKFLSLFAVAAMTLTAMATEFTVFDGTDQNEYIPFRATYFDYSPYCGQVIYPADQLTELQGKEITGIKFYVANETGNVMNGGELSVYLCATENTTFYSSLIQESEFTLVGATAMTLGESEIAFNFTEPYTYEGGNLALMVYVSVEGTYSGNGYFYGVNADVNGAAYGWYAVSAQAFYPKTTFTYEGGEEPGMTVNTLAEANVLDDNAEFTFGGDAVVTLCQNGYLFLRDESGYAQIKDVQGFENGQVLSEGWKATKTTITDPWVRYIDAAGLSASGETNAELAAAQKLTGEPDESMLNAFVYVENVTISGGLMPGLPMRALPLPDGTSIGVTSTLWSMSWPASGSKNIYGVICKVDGELKINVCEFVTYEEPPTFLYGDVNKDGNVNIGDVTALISAVLAGTTSVETDTFNPLAADLTGEGNINVGDVTALISYVLSGAGN